MPQREQRPYVGLHPTMPQNEAGVRIEPPVSDPVAAMHSPAATAAAEPPEDPPGIRNLSGLVLSLYGLRTAPYQLVRFAVPIANSSMLVLPSMTEPSSSSFWETVDS